MSTGPSPDEFLEDVLLNWAVIGNLTDLDVCVFRVASVLDDLQMTRRWLSKNGFQVNEPVTESEAVMRWYNYSGTGATLVGSIRKTK